LPWRNLVNPYSPIEILSADQVEEIHLASLRVLEELGIAFLLPEALDILADAGAEVDHASQVVRFDRGLVEQSMATAPSRTTSPSARTTSTSPPLAVLPTPPTSRAGAAPAASATTATFCGSPRR
jgi:trimethylamine:corrinoid methyltransferase-like protein